jgi:hypothetical protein
MSTLRLEEIKDLGKRGASDRQEAPDGQQKSRIIKDVMIQKQSLRKPAE